MKLRLILLACVLSAAAWGAPRPATLRCVNDESFPGDFAEATGTNVSWKTPFFEEPLVFDWNNVHRVDCYGDDPAVNHPMVFTFGSWPKTWMAGGWQLPPAITWVSDPFIFTMRDGSILRGGLTGITGSSVIICGSRYREVELKRSEVLSGRRAQGDSLIYAGPIGQAGWQEMRNNQDGTVSPAGQNENKGIASGPGGALQFPYWDRGARLQRDLPDSVDVEFRLHAPNVPISEFRLKTAHGRQSKWKPGMMKSSLPHPTNSSSSGKLPKRNMMPGSDSAGIK